MWVVKYWLCLPFRGALMCKARSSSGATGSQKGGVLSGSAGGVEFNPSSDLKRKVQS